MNKYPTEWTSDDFDGMSWHDNVIHSIRIHNPSVDGDCWDFDLILDLDYILEWIPKGGHYELVVAPAHLTFRMVQNLKLNFSVPYKQHMMIYEIERQDVSTESERRVGYRKWNYHIHLQHDQTDSITFVATGLTQRLTKEPSIPARGGWLEDDER